MTNIEQFSNELNAFAEELMREIGETPNYKACTIEGDSVKISILPVMHVAILKIGNLEFWYDFIEDSDRIRLNILVKDWDECYKSGELGLVGVYRKRLKEIEKKYWNDED